ncbi:uncharacterized protein An01g01240, partial [Aspergillus niger]
ISGMLLTTLGYGLFIDLPSTKSWPRIILFQIVAGLGIGPNFQATLIALQANTTPAELSRGTGTFSFVRQLAAAISVVVGSVLYARAVSGQRGALAAVLGETVAQEIVEASTAAAAIVETLPVGEDRTVVFHALTAALRWVWVFYTAVAGVGFLLSLCLRDLRLGDAHRMAPGQESEELEMERGTT